MSVLCRVSVILAAALPFALAGCPFSLRDSNLAEQEVQVQNAWLMGVALPWTKAVRQTSDGGYAVAGTTYDRDTFLIKTDASGAVLWNKGYSEETSLRVKSMLQTSDGGYLLAGEAKGMALLKTDADGAVLWMKVLSGGEGSTDAANSVQETSDGGFIVAGNTFSQASGDWRQFVSLVKTDADGNAVWSEDLAENVVNRWQTGETVLESGDGGYVLAGSSESGVPGATECWVHKADADGNEVWHRAFPVLPSRMETPVELLDTGDGGFLFASQVSVYTGIGIIPTAVMRFNLRKVDSAGNLVWKRSSDTPAMGMCSAADGGFLLVENEFGASPSGAGTVRAVKLDHEGHAVWVKSLWSEGNDITSSAVQPASDGGYVIVGQLKAQNVFENPELCLIKIDADGNPIP